MDSHVQVQTNGSNDVLDLKSQFSGWSQDQGLGALFVFINSLQGRDGESGSLTGTGLGLGKDITTFSDWQDSSLLNGRWGFVTVTKDTSHDVRLQVQVIELVHDIVVVGFDQIGVNFLNTVGGHDC